MAGTEKKRIIELTEASTVQSGDFIAVDSNARGTKKVSTDALATSAALTAETNARAGADEQMSERMDGIEEQTALIQNPTKTLSGALVSFTDGADMPMVACTAEITPKQSGTGTPSPDNVRQISGWESVNVYDTGVNVWDEEWESGYIMPSTGEEVADASKIRMKNYIPVLPNTMYYKKTPTGFWNVYFDADKNYISYGDAGQGVFTTPSNAFYLRSGFEGTYGTTYNNDISINYPSTDTEYHAYNPNSSTTTIPFGQTVYGGTLDVVSGVLTVDRAIVDGGSLNWTYWTASAYYATVNNKTAISVDDIQSDIYPTKTVLDANVPNGIMCSISSEAVKKFIYIVDGDVADATALKTKLTGHQICYRINNPQTYQLTPTEVNTLLGENNVWADSGDVEITYRRDISIVINNLESALNG